MHAIDNTSTSVEAWKQQLWSTYVRLESRTESSGFYGKVNEYFRGGDSLSLVESTSQTTERTIEHIRSDGQEVFLIAFQIDGRGAVYQDDRVAETRPGEFVFYDSRKPYKLEFREPFKQLVLRLSRATLGSRANSLDNLNALAFQTSYGPTGVALDFLKNIAQRAPECERHDLQAISASAGDLVINGILSQAAGLAPRRWLFEKLRSGISNEIRDPEFGALQFARRAKMSDRSLRRLCAESGTSPGEVIMNARLHGVRRDLLAGPSGRKSITEIALSWGFNDVSYFNRSFKAAFGCTPSQWRRTSQ